MTQAERIVNSVFPSAQYRKRVAGSLFIEGQGGQTLTFWGMTGYSMEGVDGTASPKLLQVLCCWERQEYVYP